MTRAITLLIPGLTGGGAEKVIVRMASHWAALGDRVTLITLSDAADDVHRPDERVHRVALGLQTDSRGMCSAAINNWRRVRALRKAIADSDPNVVISFTDQLNVLALLANRRRFPLIVCERVDPRWHPIGRVWSALRRRTYRKADCIVVQTEAVAEFIARIAGGSRVEVIPNGIDPPGIELPPTVDRRKVIVAAGRLVAQKGFDMLIEAFGKVADQHADWSLEIYGVGLLGANLQEQIDDRQLSSRVTLAGWHDDLPAVLATSSIFALSSRYEGFPNALLDAMSHGAACVSFACPSGPEIIIRDQIDGLLVEPNKIEGLAAAIGALCSDSDLRQRLGFAGRDVVNRYGYAEFFAGWDRIISDLTTT